AAAAAVVRHCPDARGVLSCADGDHLRTVARDVPRITDDLPRIEFSAPRGSFPQEGLGRAALAWVTARLDPAPAPLSGVRPAPFALRADLLRAQLALLAGDGPAELQAYLDALGQAPASAAVRAALAAIAGQRPRAGDHAPAAAIERTMERAGTAGPATE